MYTMSTSSRTNSSPHRHTALRSSTHSPSDKCNSVIIISLSLIPLFAFVCCFLTYFTACIFCSWLDTVLIESWSHILPSCLAHRVVLVACAHTLSLFKFDCVYFRYSRVFAMAEKSLFGLSRAYTLSSASRQSAWMCKLRVGAVAANIIDLYCSTLFNALCDARVAAAGSRKVEVRFSSSWHRAIVYE